MDHLYYLCLVFVMLSRLFILSCGHLLRRADIFALTCDVDCVLYLGSGVVLG